MAQKEKYERWDPLRRLSKAVLLLDKGRLFVTKGGQHTRPDVSQLKTERTLLYSTWMTSHPEERSLTIRVSPEGLITGEQLIAQIRQAKGFGQ